MGWFNTIRWVMLFSIGLCREFRPQDTSGYDDRPAILLEPANARACRRNILALASVVALAGVVGANPRDLRVFGIMPDDDVGVVFLAAAICLVYVFWFVQFYLHLTTDGKVDRFAEEFYVQIVQRPDVLASRVLRHRDADLFANRIAFILVLVSWYFAISWAAGVGS